MRFVAALLVLAAAAPATAFVRSTDSKTGVCLYWTKRELPWVLHEAGSADVGFGETENALKRSFGSWQGAACSDVTFRYDGQTTRFETGIDEKADDNLNLLVWREKTCLEAAPPRDSCFSEKTAIKQCRSQFNCWQHSSGIIALTTASYSISTGVVLDADIEFNGANDRGSEFHYTAGTLESPVCIAPNYANCVATDIENTATHEIGHFIGLDHTSVGDATMYASAPTGETRKRSLEADDLAGFCEIYPDGDRTRTCTPSGTITLTPQPAQVDCSSAAAPGALSLLALLALVFPARMGRSRSPSRWNF